MIELALVLGWRLAERPSSSTTRELATFLDVLEERDRRG